MRVQGAAVEPVEETGDSSGPSTGAGVTLAVNTATRAGVDRALELEGWKAFGGCRS